MKTRPTSVTVIAWILMITALINLFMSMSSMNNPLVREIMSRSPVPLSAQFNLMYVGLFVMIACGVGMLKGQNWARHLYVGWSIFGLLFAVATSPMKGMQVAGASQL